MAIINETLARQFWPDGDPLVFATVPLLLAAVALAGVWLPARRAARVEPAAALRLE